jgi:hypothetical protein
MLGFGAGVHRRQLGVSLENDENGNLMKNISL